MASTFYKQNIQGNLRLEQLVFQREEKEKGNEENWHLIGCLNNMQILTAGNWGGIVRAPGEHRVPGVLSILRDLYSSQIYES